MFPDDEIARRLAGAEAPRSNPAAANRAISDALARAPEDPQVRLAAYRHYFYAHDLTRAAEQAEWLIAHMARRLNIPTDWRAVFPDDADFAAAEFAPGLYMQALVGLGYCRARLGAPEAEQVLTKAAALDPRDRFGGAWLLRMLALRNAEDAD